MKKALFVLVVCMLCGSVNATTPEYDIKQIKDCQENLKCDTNGELLSGVVKEYDENENLKSETSYSKGKINGDAKTYYDNGNLKSEERYVYGAKVGKSRFYYRTGELKAEVIYKNGKKNGYSKVYYEEGDLKAEILYRNGKAISGNLYDDYGKKIEMTNAHLHTVNKGKLPKIE